MNATDEAGIHQSVHFDMDLKAAWRRHVHSLLLNAALLFIITLVKYG